MDDLGLHIGLFLLSTAIIVAVSCMFTEAEDAKARAMQLSLKAQSST